MKSLFVRNCHGLEGRVGGFRHHALKLNPDQFVKLEGDFFDTVPTGLGRCGMPTEKANEQ
jgi:hypothetical protein